ncbi:hypothetical protein BRADI_2g09966v3 [Brachypodium distachyon]|uniref:Uncharacterized protein n=1 Tax=Brachypodium distachyon TaxID=15368 RepID=A0A2K2D7R0_BRADI|nr:hypothetical protein BRADI_2g09966v3 [Brachypodium distachyon]
MLFPNPSSPRAALASSLCLGRRQTPLNSTIPSSSFPYDHSSAFTSRNRIYHQGSVSKKLLTHKQVVPLSKKIKDGIWLQHQRSNNIWRREELRRRAEKEKRGHG